MTSPLLLYLYHGQELVTRTKCLSFSLDKEIYTPYDSVSAEFLAESIDYSLIDRIAVYHENICIFHGLADEIRQYFKNHANFILGLLIICSFIFPSCQKNNETEVLLKNHNNLPANFNNELEDPYESFFYQLYDPIYI